LLVTLLGLEFGLPGAVTAGADSDSRRFALSPIVAVSWGRLGNVQWL
jgi:hypothetical protein